MGSCATKPGCPPCDRLRGWGPEWDGDLCNKGIAIVEAEVQNGSLVYQKDGVTLKPSVLVGNAFKETGNFVTNFVDEIENVENEFEKFIHLIIQGVEIFVLLVLGILAAYFLFRLCSACWSCFRCIRTCTKRRTPKVNDNVETAV